MSIDPKRPWSLSDFDPWPLPRDDNPFAPKSRLGDILSGPDPLSSPSRSLAELAGLLDPSPSTAANPFAPKSRLGDILSGPDPLSSPSRSLAELAGCSILRPLRPPTPSLPRAGSGTS